MVRKMAGWGRGRAEGWLNTFQLCRGGGGEGGREEEGEEEGGEKRKRESREQGEALNPENPSPGIYFLHQTALPKGSVTFPNSTTPWDQVFCYKSLWGRHFSFKPPHTLPA